MVRGTWLDHILEPLERKAQDIVSTQDTYLVFKEEKKPKSEERTNAPVIYHQNHRRVSAQNLLKAAACLRTIRDQISYDAACALIEVLGNGYEIKAIKRYDTYWMARKSASAKRTTRIPKIDWGLIKLMADEIRKKKPDCSDLDTARKIRARMIKNSESDIPAVETIRKKI